LRELGVSNKSINTSTTVLKALDVLEIVAAASTPLSVSEVADQVEADKSTTYRMLSTLIDAGYVLRDDLSKRYRLSYKVVSLSRNLLAENEVSGLIQQTLKQIAAVTRETLHYSVLDGDESVLIHQVRGSQLVVVDFQIGDRVKLHCTSIGKVLLAFQDVRHIERVIDQGLPQVAANTITDPDELRKELQHVRSQGYAIDDREFSDNMRCIAVPVFERGGRVNGGISISGPDSRFTLEKLEELKTPMLEAAWTLSEQLGGIPWRTDRSRA
jgi:DNA-binding IclR family transcriptional regulator